MGAALSAVNVCCNTLNCLGCLSKTGFVSSTTAKRLNVIIIFLYAFLALFFGRNIPSWNWMANADKLRLYSDCKEYSQHFDACVNGQAIYRFSFGLLITFLPSLIGSFIGSDLGLNLHRGGFALKVVFPFIVFIIGVFIPNDFFDVFAKFSILCSVLYILIQVVSLMDFAYVLNNSWTGKYAETQKKRWLVILIGGTVCLLLAALTFPILISAQYSLQVPIVTTWVTFGVSILFTILSVSAVCPHGSVFTSAVVAAYSSFNAWSAAMTYPGIAPEKASPTASIAPVVLSFIVTACSIGWTASNIAGSPDLFHLDPEKDQQRRELAAMADIAEKAAEERRHEEDENSSLERLSPRRHSSIDASPAHAVAQGAMQWQYLMFTLVACYTCMLCTAWTTNAYPTQLDGSYLFWSQTGVAWTAQILYIWTLIAPKVFKDRDFGY